MTIKRGNLATTDTIQPSQPQPGLGCAGPFTPAYVTPMGALLGLAKPKRAQVRCFATFAVEIPLQLRLFLSKTYLRPNILLERVVASVAAPWRNPGKGGEGHREAAVALAEVAGVGVVKVHSVAGAIFLNGSRNKGIHHTSNNKNSNTS